MGSAPLEGDVPWDIGDFGVSFGYKQIRMFGMENVEAMPYVTWNPSVVSNGEGKVSHLSQHPLMVVEDTRFMWPTDHLISNRM